MHIFQPLITRCLVIGALCAIALPVSLDAQVGPQQRRTEQLEAARAAIVREPAVDTSIFALICPFYGPRPIVVQRTDPAVQRTQPADTRLPDAAALAAVAEQFQPVSSLVMGERRVLNMGGGRLLPEGHTFNARIATHSYPVTIQDITERSYVLRLGEATLTRTFASTSPQIQGITRPGE